MIEVTEIMPLCLRSIFRESDRCQHLDFFFFLPNDLSHIRFILMSLNTRDTRVSPRISRSRSSLRIEIEIEIDAIARRETAGNYAVNGCRIEPHRLCDRMAYRRYVARVSLGTRGGSREKGARKEPRYGDSIHT